MMTYKEYNDFLIEKALFKDGGFDRYDNYLNDINDSKETLENFNEELKFRRSKQ
jgi:hypothetical protein